MEGQEGEKREGEKVGGEAMDGGDAEQRLQRDQQPQQLADALGREFRAGRGFVAGQARDGGDIDSENRRADPGQNAGCAKMLMLDPVLAQDQQCDVHDGEDAQ